MRAVIERQEGGFLWVRAVTGRQEGGFLWMRKGGRKEVFCE